MKAYKKIVAALCTAAMMVSVLSVSAWAVPSGITVQVNGQEVTFPDAEPESKNGRTFIPVRAAFEALGAEVTWDQADKSVTAVKGDTTVVMTLDSTKAEITEDGRKQRAYDGCGALQQRRPYLCASAFCGRSVFLRCGLGRR